MQEYLIIRYIRYLIARDTFLELVIIHKRKVSTHKLLSSKLDSKIRHIQSRVGLRKSPDIWQGW